MPKQRKGKAREYRFKIDAYSPETMPLSVLSDYLRLLAEMLGEDQGAHLVRIEDGCTCPVIAIDREAEPKIKRRVQEIESGDAPPKALAAFNQISRKLRDDGADEGAIITPRGGKLIEFPIKEEAPLSYGQIKQQESIDGIPVRVGGKKKDKATVHLEPVGGGEVIVCTTSRPIAARIAHFIFSKVIRVQGVGRWIRHPGGRWEMLSFKIADFEPLADESEISLELSIERLRAIPAAWKELPDPVGELLKIRYGTDEPNADLAKNGHSPEV